MKLFKLVSVATLVAITFGGCGNSSGGKNVEQPVVNKPIDQNQTQAVTGVSDEVKLLAEMIALNSSLAPDIGGGEAQASDLKQDRARETHSCRNGGTVEMTTPDPQDMFEGGIPPVGFDPNNMSYSITERYVNCIQDGETTNGSMKQDIRLVNGRPADANVTYMTDFTATGADAYTIKKDSMIHMERDEQNNTLMTQAIHVIVEGKTYKSENLKTKSFASDTVESFYPISGKEQISDKIYTVDPAYDASKTPMVLDETVGLKKGGKYKYVSNENHKITIEATNNNELTATVDTNGDGTTDQLSVVRP